MVSTSEVASPTSLLDAGGMLEVTSDVFILQHPRSLFGVELVHDWSVHTSLVLEMKTQTVLEGAIRVINLAALIRAHIRHTHAHLRLFISSYGYPTACL